MYVYTAYLTCTGLAPRLLLRARLRPTRYCTCAERVALVESTGISGNLATGTIEIARACTHPELSFLCGGRLGLQAIPIWSMFPRGVFATVIANQTDIRAPATASGSHQATTVRSVSMEC